MSGKDLVSGTDLVPRYTQTDLENARTKGQLVGWLQGAGVMFVVLMVVGLIGWIPAIVVGIGAAALLYKLLKH
jgi:hypothetical protein